MGKLTYADHTVEYLPDGSARIKYPSITITTGGMEIPHVGGKPVTSVEAKQARKKLNLNWENKKNEEATVLIINSNSERTNIELIIKCE